MKSNKTAWRALQRPVTFGEAAKLLGVSVAEVRRMVLRGKLLTITSRRRRLIPTSEMRAALEP